MYEDCTNLDDLNYLRDRRVRAARKEKLWEELDERQMLARILVDKETDDGVDCASHWVPFSWDVCPTCDGKGTHVNPSIDAGGLSHDHFDEDPDFMDDYMGGVYDVACYECGGRRVVPFISPERLALIEGWLGEEGGE